MTMYGPVGPMGPVTSIPTRSRAATGGDPIDDAITRAIGGGAASGGGMQRVSFADGSLGFFDPTTGGYFDMAGNPVQVSPPKAATTYAPQYPTVQVGNNGDVVSFDPYTGKPTVIGNVPSLAQQPDLQTFTDQTTGMLMTYDPHTGRTGSTGVQVSYPAVSPQEQRGNDLSDIASERAFQAGENATTRAATAGENALDRAIRSQDLAASISAQNQTLALQADEDYQNRLRQYGQDKLDAADRFASLISATDPGALPAFLRAGGGVIANAIANGATAQSDLADLPAARAQRAGDELTPPQRFVVNPFTYTPPEPVRAPVAAAPVAAPVAAAPAAAPAAVARAAAPATAANKAFVAEQDAANAGLTGAARAAYDQAFGPSGTWGVPRYALGTADPFATPFSGRRPRYATGTFVSGDSTDPLDPAAGGAHPEAIHLEDPPGADNARAEVTPLVPPGTGPTDSTDETARLSSLFNAIGDFLRGATDVVPPRLPRFAFGTDSLVTPQDQPYLDQVRDIRTNTEYPELNPFSTMFATVAPSMRDRFFAGRQLRYGVPVGDQQAEEQRFRIPGVARGLSQGI